MEDLNSVRQGALPPAAFERSYLGGAGVREVFARERAIGIRLRARVGVGARWRSGRSIVSSQTFFHALF